MKRYDILNLLIKTFNYKRYLEIGVSVGDCFTRVNCDYRVGVDPCDSELHPNVTPDAWYIKKHPVNFVIIHEDGTPEPVNNYICTSDDYFKSYITDKFDIIFIDGLHHSEQVLKDIENSLQWLTPNGSIVCHDMNPLTEKDQLTEPVRKIHNGDCWKALVTLRATRDNVKVFTVNTDDGCSVLRSGKANLLQLPCNINLLNYGLFEKYRKEWLNLISVDDFKRWIHAHKRIIHEHAKTE